MQAAPIESEHIMNDTMVDESVITCPACGAAKTETMPTDT
jgi:hypothetical protein